MSWKEGFYAAMLEFTQARLGRKDAVEVTGITTASRDIGYCETCSYTTTFIDITYRDAKGSSRTVEWRGDFADLMRALSS